ncbi:MAG: acyl-CoA dehydrogenase family protein, partial [Rhodospirillales bacterium]|nr:acyl-CoA dehydrogenase family protein [Rhodospirillales bacterium]
MILNEAQEMIRDTARRFAETELKPTAAERDRTGDFPTETLRQMGTLGLMGVGVSEEWGGGGADYMSLGLAVEEVATGDGAMATIMSTHNSLGCLPIYRHGTDEQKERFLKSLARGEMVGGFSITESQSGSNAADIRCRATPDGDDYIIDGTKHLVTSGSGADVINLFASTDPAAGPGAICCFIVPMDLPGVEILRVDEKMGIRASGTASISYSQVRVPKDLMLGEPGEGYRIALEALGISRLGIAAQAVGLAQAALNESLAYAKERESFGKPIIHHQAVGFRLADMATQTEAARQLTYQALALLDAGLPFQKESSMAKLFAGEMAERVCSDAVQIFGG